MGTKNPFEARKVVSRRNRPAKEPLSREAIVKAALELLASEGLEGMSLRKVAAQLHTGPASLYVYVENLPALQALVLDQALADVELPSSTRGTWRKRLDALLRSYLQVLFKRPGLAQLAMTTVAAGPHALRIFEALLGLFDEAGLEPAVAAWAVDLITLYVTAVAAEQSHHRQQEDPLGPVTRAIRLASPEQFPRVHALREELLSGGSTRVTWALEVLITGILKTPLPRT
ncbi:TetR/AcrR family transcriptional regulator [Vitiosangium sp. GDMCC 1.1324]|uniref:TetR/AcrR family transcriptional regulator n=1 Tax=Vitiosangium sp. (strain GDMCC 1.1324) TaxID=2138576 RepID=UPI000D3D00A6|nr:TetR/AcrR family transcriptional regulator C-terminal domain-containing protein [Vitiosangium sp. GDMCC 1.1324]PTL75480.1 TetR family transcriptional regulator [Vitiosangium sp. GDMCC 1.1324]